MPPRYTVHKKDLVAGAKVESKEHPGFSDRTHRKIARQHLERYGPGYYRAEPVAEKITENINRKMGAKPIRRRSPPQPGIFYRPPGYI